MAYGVDRYPNPPEDTKRVEREYERDVDGEWYPCLPERKPTRKEFEDDAMEDIVSAIAETYDESRAAELVTFVKGLYNSENRRCIVKASR